MRPGWGGVARVVKLALMQAARSWASLPAIAVKADRLLARVVHRSFHHDYGYREVQREASPSQPQEAEAVVRGDYLRGKDERCWQISETRSRKAGYYW